MNPFSRDAGIPVLTEVLSPFAESDEQKSDSAAIASPEAEPIRPEVATNRSETSAALNINAFEFQAVSLLSEEDWKRLERRIRERILIQIQSKVDAMLEQRIRDSLADVLQIALQGLTDQLRDGLHKSLEDVISHAVSQEISRLQTSRK